MTADILIVDDEPAVRELLKLVVRTMDMPFREAQDGIDALEKIEADPPAMIILDVMMPRMDGLTLLKKLRTQAETAAIPVLLFTAFRVPSQDIEDLNMPPSMIMNKGSMSVSAIRAAVRDSLKKPQPKPERAPVMQPPIPARPPQTAQQLLPAQRLAPAASQLGSSAHPLSTPPMRASQPPAPLTQKPLDAK